MATSEARGYGVSDARPSGWAVGFVVFAAVMMMLAGGFQTIAGIAAIFEDEFFVVGPNYVYDLDVTAWGWIHLIAGIIVALAGLALFQGAVWARTVAVILACVSILASFLWMPFYPVWSIAVIVFDVFVIWAVTAHGRDVTNLNG